MVPISQKRMLRLSKVKDSGGGPATGVMAQHYVHSTVAISHQESSGCRDIVFTSPHLMTSSSSESGNYLGGPPMGRDQVCLIPAQSQSLAHHLGQSRLVLST